MSSKSVSANGKIETPEIVEPTVSPTRARMKAVTQRPTPRERMTARATQRFGTPEAAQVNWDHPVPDHLGWAIQGAVNRNCTGSLMDATFPTGIETFDPADDFPLERLAEVRSITGIVNDPSEGDYAVHLKAVAPHTFDAKCGCAWHQAEQFRQSDGTPYLRVCRHIGAMLWEIDPEGCETVYLDLQDKQAKRDLAIDARAGKPTPRQRMRG